MEFFYITIVEVITLIIITIVFDVSTRKIKEIAENSKELDELAQKYPNNIEIGKYLLKKLKNENVKIEENNEGQTSLYIAITNKIVIANLQKSFTRIQTIAHECLHSVQDRKLLIFNFVYSNIYLLYFIVILILGILNLINYKMTFLAIFFMLGLLYYAVRVYLENDAMIKARYLAKEYMEEQHITNKEEINKIVEGFDKINNIGIKGVNLSLVSGILKKAIVLTLVFLIF